MNEAKIKACRDEQASRVMPLIGGLLDAWDDLPNDIKEDAEILHFAEHVEAIDNAMEQAAGDRQPEASPNAGNIAGSVSANGSASPSRVRKMYDALKTITKYQTPARLRKDSERLYGLAGDEAMDIAYENIIEHARSAIHGMRKPK